MTLLELFELLKKHLKLVVVLPLACALVVGVYSFVGIRNEYTATTSMYVVANQTQDSNVNLSSGLSASQMIANDVSTLLESDRVRTQTAQDLGLDSLRGYDVSVSSETTSRVIEVSVTAADPEGAANVANAMAQNVSAIASDVMKVDAVNIIDSAAVPESPSGPSRPLYIAVAFLGGFFVAVCIVVLSDMLNTKVRSSEDVEEILGIPVIGRIPTVGGGGLI